MAETRKTICHRDGTVTYWSTHDQVHYHRTHHVAVRDLAAMPADDRDRVTHHLMIDTITDEED